MPCHPPEKGVVPRAQNWVPGGGRGFGVPCAPQHWLYGFSDSFAATSLRRGTQWHLYLSAPDQCSQLPEGPLLLLGLVILPAVLPCMHLPSVHLC